MDRRRRRNPLWIPPFLGRVPAALDDRALQLLGAVALALLFEEYDVALLTSALKQIALELGMAEADLGLYLAVIRVGALPAFFVIPLADRLGRRPIFIYSIAITGALTFATAFSQGALQFVVLQAAARTFIVAGSAVAFVIVTEEFPAQHRGWGIGMLAALGAAGHGVEAAVYSQVDILPYGWRSLYALGAIPIVLIPFFLRRVSETARFTRGELDRDTTNLMSWRSVWVPLQALAATHPMRALGVAATSFAASVAITPSFQFSSYFTQMKLGWEPQHYSVLLIAGGAIGIVGNVVAGVLGDRFGRRLVGLVLLSGFPAASFGFYHGGTYMVALSWVALVFCSMGGRVILRALATELFPTSHRAAASGMFAALDTLGAVVGLLGVYVYGTQDVDDIARVVPLIAAAIVVAAVVLLGFPETRRRELEELSVE